jgi:hypothetical protein
MVPCSMEVVVADTQVGDDALALVSAVVEALGLALASEGCLWLAAALLALSFLLCPFLFDLLLHDLSSLYYCSSPGHIFLLEPEMLIFLQKVCQLHCDGNFNFLFRISVLIIVGFNF